MNFNTGKFVVAAMSLIFIILLSSTAKTAQDNESILFFIPSFLATANQDTLECNQSSALLLNDGQACETQKGFWYSNLQLCSCLTTDEHLLVGTWKDSEEDTTVSYHSNGSYSGEEFGISYTGYWAPTSTDKASRTWQENGDILYITLLTENTYEYDNAPSLGLHTRVE